MLLISSANGLKFHNCENFDIVQEYKPVDNSAVQRSVSWCRDGTLLALVTNKGNGEIIRTKEDVKLIQSISGLGQVSAITFPKTTKKNIAVGTTSGALHVYEFKSRSSKKVFSKTGEAITLLEYNSKDTHLAVLRNNGDLTLYNNTMNVKSSTITLKESQPISTFRFHSSRKGLLSCASDEGAVSIWDCNSSKNKFFIQSHCAPVTDLVFSPQNDTLLTSTSLDRSFHCYDISQEEVALTVPTSQPLSAIDMAPDGFTIAVGSIRGIILVYDLRKYQSPLTTIQAHDSEIKKILFQPHDSHFTETIDISEDVQITTQSNTNVDSFSNMISNVNEFSPKADQIDHSNASKKSMCDSFLAALSPAVKQYDNLSQLRDMSNLKITEGVKKWIMDSSNPHCSGLPDLNVDPNFTKVTNCKSSSTPLNIRSLNAESLNADEVFESPIISSMLTGNNINSDEIRKIIKETVQQSLNEVVDEKMKEIMDSMHKYYLNLLMTFCKQFVFQENILKKLSTEPRDNQLEMLKEENEFLRKKLNEYMEKNK